MANITWSPLFPADRDIQEVANKVKGTLEEKIGCKFEEYKALTYRQSPYIPPPFGPGPVLLEVCYLIKIETIPEKQSIHIVVHVNTQTGQTILVSYQVDLDLRAPLDKLYIFGPAGQQYP